MLVTARGQTLRGEPFTREQLRTLAVWNGGDDRPPATESPGTSKLDLCELLRCVLSGGSLTEAAKRAGIDLDELMACLDRTC